MSLIRNPSSTQTFYEVQTYLVIARFYIYVCAFQCVLFRPVLLLFYGKYSTTPPNKLITNFDVIIATSETNNYRWESGIATKTRGPKIQQ